MGPTLRKSGQRPSSSQPTLPTLPMTPMILTPRSQLKLDAHSASVHGGTCFGEASFGKTLATEASFGSCRGAEGTAGAEVREVKQVMFTSLPSSKNATPRRERKQQKRTKYQQKTSQTRMLPSPLFSHPHAHMAPHRPAPSTCPANTHDTHTRPSPRSVRPI